MVYDEDVSVKISDKLIKLEDKIYLQFLLYSQQYLRLNLLNIIIWFHSHKSHALILIVENKLKKEYKNLRVPLILLRMNQKLN